MDDDEHAVNDTDRDDADRDQITVKQPTRFENARRLPFTLDEFSSSEDERRAMHRRHRSRRSSRLRDDALVDALGFPPQASDECQETSSSHRRRRQARRPRTLAARRHRGVETRRRQRRRRRQRVARSSRRGYGVPVALASPRVCCSTTHALKAHPPILRRRRRRLLASPSRVPSHARARLDVRSEASIERRNLARWCASVETNARARERHDDDERVRRRLQMKSQNDTRPMTDD